MKDLILLFPLAVLLWTLIFMPGKEKIFIPDFRVKKRLKKVIELSNKEYDCRSHSFYHWGGRIVG